MYFFEIGLTRATLYGQRAFANLFLWWFVSLIA